jgi:hypothetical protein
MGSHQCSMIGCGTGVIVCLLALQVGAMTTAAAGRPSCLSASELNTSPVAHRSKVNEVDGGIFWVGGPPRPAGSCQGVQRIAGTITVRASITHSVVAKALSTGKRGYHIRLHPGSYIIESSACDLSGPVSITARKHEVVSLDFVCNAP